MSSITNTSLRKAVSDLSQALHSSLGPKQDCIKAIANIEEMLSSIEYKLNALPDPDTENKNSQSNETLSFAPEKAASII